MKSLEMLWNHLGNNEGFSFLLTNRLNQDCVENLFSVIRGRGGNRDNPNPEQFRAAFRQVIVEKLLIQSESSNCSVDVDKVLLDLGSMSQENISRPIVNENVNVVSKETLNIFDVMSFY